MKPLLAILLCLEFCLTACSKPKPNEAIFSPSGSRWVRVQTLPPDESLEQLLPTYRMRLEGSGILGHLDLISGVESLCGIDSHWVDDEKLLVRLPVRQAKAYLPGSTVTWHGVDIRVDLHEDQVKQQAYSPDGQRRLVVINDCVTGDWNLYLRRAGEPNFNAAMELGWDDPDVAGGFSASQPPTYLRWTGPRTAEIGIPDKQYQVSVRDKVGDVTVKWKFLQKLVVEKERFESLKPLGADGR